MNEKVVLTKVQAESVEDLKKINTPEEIVSLHLDKEIPWQDEWKPLNELSLDVLIRALYIGYEVEKTPEEELVEAYLNKKEHGGARCGYFAEGIRFAVDKLGQKIKGINE